MVSVINYNQNISDQQKLAILAMTREYREQGFIKGMVVAGNKVCILVPNLKLYAKITAELKKLTNNEKLQEQFLIMDKNISAG